MSIEQIKKKHLLIDGDIIRYRCGYAAEKMHYLVDVDGDDYEQSAYECSHCRVADFKAAKELAGKDGVIWTRKEVQPVEFALQAVTTTLEAMSEGLEPSGISLFLSGGKNFRDSIAVTKKYKGNRDAMPKPKHYNAIGEYLVKQYGAEYTDGYEADDAIGCKLSAHPDTHVCVSTDKDLDQISGWHFNWVSGNAYWVSRRAGDFQFYLQLLTGDTVDNVPGLEGVGPIRAQALLEGALSSAELCKRAWTEYRDRLGNTEQTRAYFIEQANLVYIWRKDSDSYVCPITLE